MNQPHGLAFSMSLLCLVFAAEPLFGSNANAELAKLSTLPILVPNASDGDYQIKPPFAPAPEQTPKAGVPKGRIVRFTLSTTASKFYPDTGLKDAKSTRPVTVYIPAQYVEGTPAPLLLTHDAMGSGNNQLAAILDNLIAARRVPPLVAVMVPSGGGNGGGSERGLEYDTVSGKYAEFIQAEVLPKIAHDYHVTVTSDPEGRATMGGSSGGAAAFSMAWFHPDLYRRVLTYSGTYKNNQSPIDPAFPHGAWEYHEHLIAQSAAKPLRVWLEVGGNDHGVTDAAEMHNTAFANLRMAAALKAKGYHYQFVYAVGANHVDKQVVAQTLPQALEWLWRDYTPAKVSATVLHFRGRPATEVDRTEMARLTALPALTAGSGEGDYLIKPPYAPAPEQTAQTTVPKGRSLRFTLRTADSKFYPDTGLRDTKPTRTVTVYIPAQYVPGTPAPLLVTHDAMGLAHDQLATILDNLIAAHRVPVLVAVMVPSGGGDARGSERGLEYDTVSGKFAEFIEAEVLPPITRDYHVTFTRNPDGRATMGGSSGGAAAFSMAWFHPEWYRRVLTYSGTYTNNQSPENPALLHGAWEYHEHLIPQNPAKPIRIWMEVGEHDNGSVNTAADLHNWVIANERMAGALKAKGYHYQFVYAEAAGHVDRKVVAQTLPRALEWLWQGYTPTKD